MTIKESASFNYFEKGDFGDYTPDKAHDGDYDTWYSVKNGAVAGNFLKLYLSQAYSIGQVKMTGRAGYVELIVNTEVRVYSTVSGETEVDSCGKITGASSFKVMKVLESITNSFKQIWPANSPMFLANNNENGHVGILFGSTFSEPST